MTWPLLLGSGIPQAAADVEAWGYPRPLEAKDLACLWFAPYPQVRLWLEVVRDTASHGIFHLAIAPTARRRIYSRGFWRQLYDLGERLGLDFLWALEDDGMRLAPDVQDYLVRLGMVRTRLGFCKPLGGEHGSNRRRSHSRADLGCIGVGSQENRRPAAEEAETALGSHGQQESDTGPRGRESRRARTRATAKITRARLHHPDRPDGGSVHGQSRGQDPHGIVA